MTDARGVAETNRQQCTGNGADLSPPPRSLAPDEAAVLGSLIRPDGASYREIAAIVRREDFSRPDHRLIFDTITKLVVATDQVHDVVTIYDRLESSGSLEDAGGLAYLRKIADEAPTPANAIVYAGIVRDRAVGGRLQAELLCARGADLAAILERELARLRETITPAAPAIQLVHIAAVVAEKRETDWLDGLEQILERSVLAVLAGSRGTFKSFIALHWSLSVALKRLGVVFLSAEGRGLGVRTEAWMRTHAPNVDVRELPIVVLERAVDLSAAATLEALHAAIDGSGVEPALFVIDTLSKFSPGLDENENADVAFYLSSLSSALRDRYGATVLLVAHSGHGDSGRPRGASTLMANPDAEYIVKRVDPTAMTVTVTRERFKDSPSLPPLAYNAETVDLGRADSHGEPISSLVMRDTVVSIARPKLGGRNQKALLAQLERLVEAPGCLGVWTEGELRKIGREILGLEKQSARDAVLGLRKLEYLVATVGGYRLAFVPESGQKGRNGAESQNSAQDARAEKAERSIDLCLSSRPPSQISADQQEEQGGAE